MFYITQNRLIVNHKDKTVRMIQQQISKHKSYTSAEKVFKKLLTVSKNTPAIQFYYNDGNHNNPNVMIVSATTYYKKNWQDLFKYHESKNYTLI